MAVSISRRALPTGSFQSELGEVRQFFPYDQTRDGILTFCAELFGLKFEPNAHAPRWHVSVDAYEVYREDKHLGRFYLDMHPRDGKFKHAAVFPIQGGKAGQHFPMASLVCNFRKVGPSWSISKS